MRLVRHLAMILIFLVPAAASAAPPTEGRWTLHAAGRPFILLELRRDALAKGGWTGSLSRPAHFTASSNFALISEVEGPAVREQIVEAIERAEELELTVRDSSSELTQLVWKPSDDGGGRLRYKSFPFPPLALVPATSDERVPNAWDKAKTYSAMLEWADNAEITKIFQADQAARANPEKIDWAVLGLEDQARRKATKALIDAGKLRSGTDFYHAAFVFQHGGSAEHYLLAHSLAVIAAARGRPDATWIASATLDRYLQSIGQKQIFGTQFTTPAGKPTTQEPYDRALVSDALREALGVPPLAAQEERRREIEARSRANVR